MRLAGGLTNGPRSRENILKQETRFLRRLPTVLPYFPASPTMRDARRSKISLNATSRRRKRHRRLRDRAAGRAKEVGSEDRRNPYSRIPAHRSKILFSGFAG